MSDITGLTGMYKVKAPKDGKPTFVGSADGEYLMRLITAILKAASKAGYKDTETLKKVHSFFKTLSEKYPVGVVFFLKVWAKGEAPRLACAPMDPERAKNRKSDDDPFGSESPSSGDDPFGGSSSSDDPFAGETEPEEEEEEEIPFG